jgi:hypothetical protein
MFWNSQAVQAQLLTEIFAEKDHLVKLNFYSDSKDTNIEGKLLFALGCDIDSKKRDIIISSKKKNANPEMNCTKDPKSLFILLLTQSGKKLASSPEDYKKYIIKCNLEREIDMSKINTYKYVVNFSDCQPDKPYF